MSFVFIPLKKNELIKYIDDKSLDILAYFTKSSVFSKPETFEGQNKLKLEIPKTYVEQWVLQAIGGQYVGGGSYPVDLIKDKIGVDVKSLTCKLKKNNTLADSESGEASICQNFEETGNILDNLFKNKNYDTALKEWIELFKNKCLKVEDEYNINKIIYIFLLNAHHKFYICGCSVNLDYLDNIQVKNATQKSIFTKGFINDDLGNVKLYKSKKRLELRLRPKKWVDEGYCHEIPMPEDFSSVVNLRNQSDLKKIENEKIKKFIDFNKKYIITIFYMNGKSVSALNWRSQKDIFNGTPLFTIYPDSFYKKEILLDSENSSVSFSLPKLTESDFYTIQITDENKFSLLTYKFKTDEDIILVISLWNDSIAIFKPFANEQILNIKI